MKPTRPSLISGQQLRLVLEDCILPLLVSFLSTCLFFWISGYFNENGSEVISFTGSRSFALSTRKAQVYLNRHGIQKNESDAFHDSRTIVNGIFQSNQTKSMINFNNHSNFQEDESPGAVWPWPRAELAAAAPIVWVVTPTYRNPYQYAELTRTAQALYPVRRFVHWLLVDDTKEKDNTTLKQHMQNLSVFINQFHVNFTLLRAKIKSVKQKVIFKPKGVDARRTALHYIRQRKLRGIVYFADDDNTYDSDIFRQMQSTQTVSVWPTGAITQWTISSPVVNNQGKVIDFFDAWVANRKFPVDFASFAVNADLIHQKRKANIPWIQGYEETIFLRSLSIKKSKFMPLAANATHVLTWHTKSIKYIKGNIDASSRDVRQWPSSVQRLANKYEFLFEKIKQPKKETEQPMANPVRSS